MFAIQTQVRISATHFSPNVKTLTRYLQLVSSLCITDLIQIILDRCHSRRHCSCHAIQPRIIHVLLSYMLLAEGITSGWIYFQGKFILVYSSIYLKRATSKLQNIKKIAMAESPSVHENKVSRIANFITIIYGSYRMLLWKINIKLLVVS